MHTRVGAAERRGGHLRCLRRATRTLHLGVARWHASLGMLLRRRCACLQHVDLDRHGRRACRARGGRRARLLMRHMCRLRRRRLRLGRLGPFRLGRRRGEAIVRDGWRDRRRRTLLWRSLLVSCHGNVRLHLRYGTLRYCHARGRRQQCRVPRRGGRASLLILALALALALVHEARRPGTLRSRAEAEAHGDARSAAQPRDA